MLKSNSIWLRVAVADHDYGCAGDGGMHDVRQFSPLCDRSIRKGQTFVEDTDIEIGERKVPRHLFVRSRHCSHCALAFFPAVKVDGLPSASDLDAVADEQAAREATVGA